VRFLKELDVHHEGVLVGDAVIEGLVVDVQDVLTSAAPPPATSAADLGRKRMRMRMMINMGMRMRIRVRRMPPPPATSAAGLGRKRLRRATRSF
jgi:hypothetical protein